MKFFIYYIVWVKIHITSTQYNAIKNDIMKAEEVVNEIITSDLINRIPKRRKVGRKDII